MWTSLLEQHPASQPLTSLSFNPARHRLLIQPPPYQTADSFLLSSFPQTSQSFVWSRLSCQPSCATSLLFPARWAWPAADPMPRPWIPHNSGATNQPRCPCCCPMLFPLFPLSVFEQISLQGSKPDTRCDECSVVFPTAAVHFTLLISSDQISLVMNKSKAATNNYFHLHLMHPSFFSRKSVMSEIMSNVNKIKVIS